MEENYTYTDELGDLNLSKSLCDNPFVVPTNFFAQQQQEIQNQIKLNQQFDSNLMNENNVPQNYFKELESNIFAKIKETELKEKVEADGFEIPQNYFRDLSSNIQDRIFEEELKSITTNTDFEVPNEYFSTLENSIMSKISEANLKKLVSKDGFEAPQEYFSDLEAEIKSNLSLEKLSLNNQLQDPFIVPTGYFEELENKIKNKVSGNTPVISLPKRKTNWYKYSTAAAILLVGIGTYLNFNSGNIFNSNTEQISSQNLNLEGISDQELVSYLAEVSEDQDLLQLSGIIENQTTSPIRIESEIKDDDIEEYLKYML